MPLPEAKDVFFSWKVPGIADLEFEILEKAKAGNKILPAI
jgi:hypothetical protein